ncbi:MAG: archease [Anaerolineaceae bacterium]|nr:archease [Anaerolineaceae bacterium]
MDSQISEGVSEVSHTADQALHIKATSLEQLFVKAAEGMYSLAGVKTDQSILSARQLIVSGIDPESLLVAFLSELLYLLEEEKIAFHYFNLGISADSITCSITGSPVSQLRKSIKAVTFHNLKIQTTAEGYETTLVFDV